MKDFPNRWIFGDKKDDTGDISKSTNIKFYKKYCKDIELLTSDCGLSRDENWEVKKEMNIMVSIQKEFLQEQ